MKKLTILTIVLSLMLVASSAFAEGNVSIDYNSSTLEATVSAILPGASNRVCAVVCAMFDEEPTAKSARELLLKASNVVAYDHVASDADGRVDYLFEISEDAPLGEYYVVITDGKSANKASFSYYSEAAMKAFLKELNSETDEADYVAALIESYNTKRLPIMPQGFADLNDAQKADAASIIFDRKTNDLESFKAVCNEAIVLTKINSSDKPLNEVTANASALGIDAKDVTNLTDEQKEYFENIFPSNFEGYGEVKDAYYECIVLSVASKPKTYMDIKDALTMYEDYSIDMTGDYEKLSNKNAVFKKMLAYDFKTMKELQDNFSNVVSQQKYEEENTNTSLGKGSGGGGGGGISSATVSGAVSGMGTAPNEAENIFYDLSGYEWGKASINALASKNIINGDGNGKFRPADPVTRAEFVKMLVLALEVSNTKAEASFDDVKADSWAYPYIASASSLGIINGVGESKFAPDAFITREDMSVIVHRALTLFAVEFTQKGEEFDDSALISSYAQNAVSSLSGSGIIKGSDSKFMPKDNTNRAQAAVVIDRVLALLD